MFRITRNICAEDMIQKMQKSIFRNIHTFELCLVNSTMIIKRFSQQQKIISSKFVK